MGILTGCPSACQTDWLANYWGLVLQCGEIILTGKSNKRLMGRGCQLVCVMVSFLYQHSSLCGWVRRPSLTIILSHLSISHTHTEEIKKHTHTRNVGSGVKWCLEGVNLGSGWRETREALITLVFYFQHLKQLFLLTNPAILTSPHNCSAFYNHIIVIYFPKLTVKCETRDKASSRQREVTVRAEPLLAGGGI